MRKVRITSDDFLCIGYAVYIIVEILSSTILVPDVMAFLQPVSKLIAVSLVAVSFGIRRNYSLLSIILCVLLAVVSALAVIKTSAYVGIFLLLIFCVGSVNVSSDKILRVFYIICFSIVFSVVLLALLGVIYDDTRGVMSAVRKRHYLGFLYTTFPPNYFFHAVLAYFSFRERKITLLNTSLVLLVNYFLYELTDTRAVYYEVILLLAVLWIIRFNPRILKPKGIRYLALVYFGLLVFLSFYLPINYSPHNAVMRELDDLLTSRLYLGNLAISRYGIPLFGRKVTWVTGRLGIERTKDLFFVDSSYLQLALTRGVFILAFFVIAFALYLVTLHKQRKYNCFIAVALLLLHSFSDPQLPQLNYNPFIMPAFYCFFKEAEWYMYHRKSGIARPAGRRVRIRRR